MIYTALSFYQQKKLSYDNCVAVLGKHNVYLQNDGEVILNGGDTVLIGKSNYKDELWNVQLPII